MATWQDIQHVGPQPNAWEKLKQGFNSLAPKVVEKLPHTDNLMGKLNNYLKVSALNLIRENTDVKVPLMDPRGKAPDTKTSPTSIPAKKPVLSVPSPVLANENVGTTINNFTRQPSGKPYYDLIVKTATEKGINPAIAAAGLFNESGIDPKAPDNNNYDKKGNIISTDRGIAQINSKAHPEVTEAQARDPNFAIPWKINKIADNINKYPDINMAIAAYNLGDEGVKNSKGPYASGLGKFAQNYINKFAKNLDPKLVKELGIKVSSPEEEAKIVSLLKSK